MPEYFAILFRRRVGTRPFRAHHSRARKQHPSSRKRWARKIPCPPYACHGAVERKGTEQLHSLYGSVAILKLREMAIRSVPLSSRERGLIPLHRRRSIFGSMPYLSRKPREVHFWAFSVSIHLLLFSGVHFASGCRVRLPRHVFRPPSLL